MWYWWKALNCWLLKVKEKRKSRMKSKNKWNYYIWLMWHFKLAGRKWIIILVLGIWIAIWRSKKCWVPHSQYNTQWWKAESLPTKIWNKIRMPTLTSSIQHSIGSPSHSNQTRKRNKRYPHWKGRGKIVIICRCYDTLYRKP